MSKKLTCEVEGKTVREAIKKALKTFKVRQDQIKIKVVSEEEKGLFGMAGAKPAKIKVSIIKDKEETSEKVS